LADNTQLSLLFLGRPPFARKLASNRLQEVLNVKKAGVLKQWVHRLCVLSDSRLFIHKGTYMQQQHHFHFQILLQKKNRQNSDKKEF